MEEKYKNLKFDFDEEDGSTCCEILYDNKEFYSFAFCSPEDMDMLSKKTGQEIAFRRASIEVMRYERECLKLELKGLNSLYYSIKHSQKYNPKSYEACMLRRQIKMRESDIAQLKEDIKTTKEYIDFYIKQKDDFYKKTRALRKQEELEREHAKDNEN